MTKKEFRILSNEELEIQVQTLKEYYWVKSKAWAIKRAIKDCSTVAEHNNLHNKKAPMQQVFTRKNKDSLMEELEVLEKFMIDSGNKKALEVYFPHTLYEVSSVLEKAIWLEI